MSAQRRPRSVDELVEMAAELARSWTDQAEPIPYLIGDADDGHCEIIALALDFSSYDRMQEILFTHTATHLLVSAVFVAEVWTAAPATRDEARGMVDGSVRIADLDRRREEVLILAQDLEGNRRDLAIPITRRRGAKVYGVAQPLDPRRAPGGRYPFRLFAFRVERKAAPS